MTCYLHSVSEVKNASESKRKYFNCIVQSNNKPIRAVCFSPEKRPELQAVAATKSPVKIKNYKQSNNDDLTITKFTKITPLDNKDVDFAYSEELSSIGTGKPVGILSIPKLAAEQLIVVKGKVVKVSGVKMLSTRYGKLKKQDVVIADPTAHVKVVLWGDHVNALQLDQTYTLNNVRVKSTKFEHYLNTPRNEDFTAIDAAPFTTPVIEYEDDVDTTSTVNGTILGVQNTSKSLGCNNCQKRAVDIIAPHKAVCQSCGFQQPPSACTPFWTLRILLKPKNGQKNIHLQLDCNTTEALLHLINPAFQLGSATEEDIITIILENYKTSLVFTYDTLTSQVSEVIRSDIA